MIKRRHIIDLSKKPIPKARKALKRLIQRRKDRFPSVGYTFLLPPYKRIVGVRFSPSQIISNCPYCGSPLIDTEAGTVCSGKNLKDIAFDIYEVVRRWGPKADLFMDIKANRFFDLWLLMGRDLTCDYCVGSEEARFRINNRILRAGIDRKTIFSSKKK
jgi:hypothetical protein